MAYFNFLPNVYVGEGVKDDQPFRYRLAKNIAETFTGKLQFS